MNFCLFASKTNALLSKSHVFTIVGDSAYGKQVFILVQSTNSGQITAIC